MKNAYIKNDFLTITFKQAFRHGRKCIWHYTKRIYINSADRSLLKLGKKSGLAIPHGVLLQKKCNTG